MMNTLFRMPLWFVLLFPLSLWATDYQPVKIASGGHVVHFLPLDIAIAHGFFEEQGLQPLVTYLKSGTPTAQALLAGQVDFSTNSIDHAFKAAARGKETLRMVVLMNRLPGMVLVVHTRYKDTIRGIADLEGLTLGVTSKGAATHMVLDYLLSKNGVSPDKVTVIKAGTSTFPPALQNGQIDGGIALEPFASMLVEKGHAFVLADLNTLADTEKTFGGPYNMTGILTRQDVIDADPELVGRVVFAIRKGLRWIATHSPREIAHDLPAKVVGTDRERYIKTLRKLGEFYSQDGQITPKGVDNVFLSMQLSGALPEDTDLDQGRFYTNRFIKP
uniref:NitT/TauT family transport system substrate-binding protein n=1 Tax=Candidatus Kentrum sp. FW TaxID=2126338 RepID=A0A450SDI4_9GAMM|nr:MAG: NitT/TauT family transport system substrate-binding protein [Candidatus Kentron sp. FW]VFJ50542.1 MAG: NitT/TauT family transport system substrate-binding protein [Candidatus Kentron sp. FW]